MSNKYGKYNSCNECYSPHFDIRDGFCRTCGEENGSTSRIGIYETLINSDWLQYRVVYVDGKQWVSSKERVACW